MILGIGGAALPPLWWLTKTILPNLNTVAFPGYSLLKNIESPTQKPDSAPLWQRLLISAMVTAFIVGFADPKWNDDTNFEKQDGPIVLIIDNDWAAAKNWSTRKGRITKILDLAKRQNKPVVIMKTAPEGKDNEIEITDPLSVKKAQAYLTSITPKPWPTDRRLSTKSLQKLQKIQNPSVFWLSNGLDYGHSNSFTQELEKLGPIRLFEDQNDPAMLLSLKQTDENDLVVMAQRTQTKKQKTIAVTAFDKNGNAIHQENVTFKKGEHVGEAKFDIPDELRRQLVKISIADQKTAGATVLLDENWRQKSVGIIESKINSLHPLLSGQNYIREVISPFTDLHSGAVDKIIQSDLSAVILTDDASLTESESKKLENWVRQGGTLLRFAGPKLAAKPNDPLLPVSLLPGKNYVGQNLSGKNFGKLSQFGEDSPFHGLTAPSDLNIDARILPDPSSDLDNKVWAQFEDGSPFITSDKKGKGRIVFVHTTANLEWSNLPISGSGELFINMMKTIISQSHSKNSEIKSLNRDLPPLTSLDHQGKIVGTVSSARPLNQDSLKKGLINAHHPAGFYGDETIQVARNIYNQTPNIKKLSASLKDKSNVETVAYQNTKNEKDWGAYLLLGSSLLLLTYMAAHLIQIRGRRKAIKKRSAKTSQVKI